MTRADIYAFFAELEPAERALKELHWKGRENGRAGLEMSVADEEFRSRYERWLEEYHPHPQFARLAKSDFGRKVAPTDGAGRKSLQDIYQQESYFNKGEQNHSVQIVKHFRYLQGEFHQHEYIEISYVHSGSCKHLFQTEQGPREVELLPGDLAIIPPGMYHKVEVFNDGVMLNILVEVLTFRDLFLQNLMGNRAMFDFFRAIIWEGKHSSVILLHTGGDAHISDVLADLIIYYVEDSLYSGQICEHLLRVWMLLILPYCTDTMELFGEASGDGELAATIIGYLQKHYMDTSLEKVAKEFHYSVSHINRILKKYTGATVLKEIRRLKIWHACRLLAETQYSVEEIAGHVGYGDTSYFIEQFRRETGTTPLQYRKRQ